MEIRIHHESLKKAQKIAIYLYLMIFACVYLYGFIEIIVKLAKYFLVGE